MAAFLDRKTVEQFEPVDPGTTFGAFRPIATTFPFIPKKVPPPAPILDPLQFPVEYVSKARVNCGDIVPGNVFAKGTRSETLVTLENVDQLRLTRGCPPFGKETTEAEGGIDVAGCFGSTPCPPPPAETPPGTFQPAVFLDQGGAPTAAAFGVASTVNGAPNGAGRCRILGADCVVLAIIAAIIVVAMMDSEGLRIGA